MSQERLSNNKKRVDVFYSEIFCLGDHTKNQATTDYVINLIIYDHLNYLINTKLDRDERKAVKLYYYKQYNQIECSKIMGVSQCLVSKLLLSAREKLLGHLIMLKERAVKNEDI